MASTEASYRVRDDVHAGLRGAQECSKSHAPSPTDAGGTRARAVPCMSGAAAIFLRRRAPGVIHLSGGRVDGTVCAPGYCLAVRARASPTLATLENACGCPALETPRRRVAGRCAQRVA
jgi:hypothetical protein